MISFHSFQLYEQCKERRGLQMIYDKILLDAIISNMNAIQSKWILKLEKFKNVDDCNNETIKHRNGISQIIPTKWSILLVSRFSDAYTRTVSESFCLNAINFNDIKQMTCGTLTDYVNFILTKEDTTETEIELMQTFAKIKIIIEFDSNSTTPIETLNGLPLPWMDILFYNKHVVSPDTIEIRATETDVPSTRMSIGIKVVNSDRKQLLEKYAAEIRADIVKKIDRKFFKSIFKIF